MDTRTRIKQVMAAVSPPDINGIAIEAIITVIKQRINSHRPGGYYGAREMAEEIYRGVRIALWSSQPCNTTDEQLQFVEKITDQIIREMNRAAVCLRRSDTKGA